MKTLFDIKKLINLKSHHNYADIFRNVEKLVTERDDLQVSHREIAGALQIQTVDTQDILKTIADVKSLLARQLSEIRYVLHGDIQPCSVLYSDETTTLLRLDECDIMCETDTIEWSDSVTYRCQELLRSGTSSPWLSAVKAMAQLVRDERILLNDNGDDVVEHRCRECNRPTTGSDCCMKAEDR